MAATQPTHEMVWCVWLAPRLVGLPFNGCGLQISPPRGVCRHSHPESWSLLGGGLSQRCCSQGTSLGNGLVIAGVKGLRATVLRIQVSLLSERARWRRGSKRRHGRIWEVFCPRDRFGPFHLWSLTPNMKWAFGIGWLQVSS